ncbi:hypothetical protein QYE76_007002 [Lolium multiflorum]|uniref:Uncharacterized protein n=1 Tax=Lolium multiflorum TaxID=4521 RepID=A0AAD8W2R6_LOLMU|nr:hypothetical protein QYE76_007002 [Lolium multiflorum]
MATPLPGFVRDLASTFDQAGASSAAGASATAAASTVAVPPSAPVPPPPPPPPTPQHVPMVTAPPATAALFLNPAQLPGFPAAPPPAAVVTATSALTGVFVNQHVQEDAFICSWLFNRVSPEILGLVHQRHPTAASIWSAIATLFLDNAETQAVFVGTDFRSLMQGDMPMLRYFARLKEYADQLADLGFPVDDKAQVMNMFRGLNPHYFYAIPILTMQLLFPSFLRYRAFLILEESRLNMAAAPPSDVALNASRAPPTGNNTSAPINVTTNGGAVRTGNGNGNRNRRGKGKAVQTAGDSGGSSSGSSSTGGPTAGRIVQMSAPASNPWTGMVHAWPMPWRPHAPGAGVLGPRPRAPPPFAGHAAQQQPFAGHVVQQQQPQLPMPRPRPTTTAPPGTRPPWCRP